MDIIGVRYSQIILFGRSLGLLGSRHSMVHHGLRTVFFLGGKHDVFFLFFFQTNDAGMMRK